jgi:hypothetical protein
MQLLPTGRPQPTANRPSPKRTLISSHDACSAATPFSRLLRSMTLRSSSSSESLDPARNLRWGCVWVVRRLL